jgi:mannose-6-phosphate isomerase
VNGETAYPMALEPRYLEKPWGGRRLAETFGRALPDGVPIGESWELFDRPAGSSRVRNGPLAGRDLASLRGGRELPLLLKLLDVRGRISVQVHPDDAVARAHGTEPKTEAWIVLEADPGARIWRGLREETDPAAFREALAKGAVEDLLHSFEPRAGDVVLMQAGTVHAAAGGLVVAEVQRSSETTYRLWDWGRGDGASRPLQVEEGMAAARLGPAGPDRIVPRELDDDGNLRRLLLVATPWFEAEHLTLAGTATLDAEGEDGSRWHALLVLSGEGAVRAFDRRAAAADFRPGDTLLLPSGHDLYEIAPRAGKVVQALLFRPA